MPMSSSNINWYWPKGSDVLCPEDNRRSGIALDLYDRLRSKVACTRPSESLTEAVKTKLVVIRNHKESEVIFCDTVAWWLSGRALDLRFTGRGFNSRPVVFHVT